MTFNPTKPTTGNIGEWSELYALLKILGEGQLQGGAADLTPNGHLALPVLAASRSHNGKQIHYRLDNQSILIESEEGQSTLAQSDCVLWAAQLLGELKLHAVTKGSRSIPQAAQWMKGLQTTQLKAQSSSKTDIHLVLHDIQTGVAPRLGFSIKSRLGAASTLFNANGDNTNAVFEVSTIDSGHVDAFNVEKNFKQKFATLANASKLNFLGYAKNIFASNLRVVDGELPVLLAYLIEFYYRGVCSSKTTHL